MDLSGHQSSYPRQSCKGLKAHLMPLSPKSLPPCTSSCPSALPTAFLQALLAAASTSWGETGLAPQETWASVKPECWPKQLSCCSQLSLPSSVELKAPGGRQGREKAAQPPTGAILWEGWELPSHRWANQSGRWGHPNLWPLPDVHGINAPHMANFKLLMYVSLTGNGN